MVHGRSAVHVANFFGVDARDLRVIAKLIEEDAGLKNFDAFFREFGMALTSEANAAIDGVISLMQMK
jgi:hypothetical protein